MTVHQLRKEGKLNEAWQKAQQQLSDTPDNHGNILEIAWVYYDFLKRETANANSINFFKICDKLSTFTLGKNDSMIKEQLAWVFFKILRSLIKNQSSNVENIQQTVSFYVQIIGFNNPSLPQSLFIKILLKLKSTIPHFWKMIPWLDPELLREEDLIPEEYNKQKIMPLAERVYYAYAKTLIDDGEKGFSEAISQIPEFIRLSQGDNAKMRFSFANYYLAEASILNSDLKKAYEFAVAFVRKNHLKGWAWSLLAKTSTDKNDCMIFLCQAISLEKKEAYLLPVRTMLTKLLLDAGHRQAAVKNIDKIIQTRENNNWPLPLKITEMQSKSWYINPVDDGLTLEAIIDSESGKALQLIFTDLITEKTVVIHKQHKNCKLLNQEGKYFTYRTSTGLTQGSWVKIKRVNNKILTHKKIEPPKELRGKIRNFIGTLIRKSNFGFVSDVFIPPHLIDKKGIIGNIECNGVAILEKNQKTNEEGWKAITLDNSNSLVNN